MLDAAQVAKRVEALRRHYAERDARHQTVYDVRSQRIDRIQPGSMPDAWPKPIVHNAIDNAARQLAENLAPLPSINCASGVASSAAAKKFVAKKTKIAYGYVISSRLAAKMPTGCDHYLTYGSLPFVVEPDWDRGMPVIRTDDPMRSYPQYDIQGRVIAYARAWREGAQQLADKFPEHADAIMGRGRWGSACSPETHLEVVKYCDKDQYVLYMPERSNLVLHRMPNRFGKVAVAIAEKPEWDGQQRGQFDDVIHPYLARARMALLALQATQQTVRAPLAVPLDVQRMALGDDALIRTNSPEKIRRVAPDMPQAAFQQEAMLGEEVRAGTRTPAAATGDVDASIITGRGVEALGQGYDIQIATGQLIIGSALQQAIELCFEMDEKYWPDAKKTVSGVINGTPFTETYSPAKDIRGNYTVSVSYGFASGMNPNQALIFLLQLRGDQLVPRDFVQRQLPMDVDVEGLQRQVDIEQTEDALKQGVFSLLASMGIMAQQGMDPTVLLRQAASVIEAREKGAPMHEAIMKAFQPQQAPAGPAAPGTPGAEEGGPGVPFGMNPSTGLPGGTAPGQAQMGPGGQPDLMSLVASLGAGGRPNLSASVKRSVPA